MTPDALRQTLEAEREALRALSDALHDQVRTLVHFRDVPETATALEIAQPVVQRLLRVIGEVNAASMALSRAIGEIEVMECVDS